MNLEPSLPRSPELLSRRASALLVVDVQQKLVPLIPHHERIIWNVRRLIDGAGILEVPVAATEQYPKGLGKTMSELAQRVGEIPSKLMFSCRGCPEVLDGFAAAGVHQILVAGVETHVCVLQTVLDLLAEGFQVHVCADATGARGETDHQAALRRMDSAGATVTTTETALFEWCEVAGTPEFKKISLLVRETAPLSERAAT